MREVSLPEAFGSLYCVTLLFKVGLLGMQENLTKGQRVGSLGHEIPACLPECLGTEVSHIVSLSYMMEPP